MINQLKLWVISGALLGCIMLGYLGYHSIKEAGYREARVEYDQKFEEAQKVLQTKLDSISKVSNALVIETRKTNTKFDSRVKKILQNPKGAHLYILKEGVCYPSEVLSNNLNLMTKEVNNSLRELYK